MIPEVVDDVVARETPETFAHLGRCAECQFTVRFQLLPSGNGFSREDGGEESLGVGEHGRPLCPSGHGELEIADDQLPAAEAIGQVAEQLKSPEQRHLPGIVPAFNFQGAYLELEVMSVEADRLHRIWEDDAREAKESKTAWEEASKRRDKSALEFRRRRLEKGNDGDPEQGATVADDLPDTADLWELVTAAGQILLPGTIEAWSDEERAAVRVWAADTTRERPAVLGRPHVAPNGYTSETPDEGQTSVEFQTCTQCDEHILTIMDGVEPYDTGVLVGTDCKGKPKKEPARYPKPRGKKKAGKSRTT